jgi:hypothetical protein
MVRKTLVSEHISEIEYKLAKYKAIITAFPDAKISGYSEFSSKLVNSIYTNLEFNRRYSGLFVTPYCDFKFEYNGKEEIIKMHSSPQSSRLVYLERWRRNSDGKRNMKFSRLKFNLKNNHFKDEMVNDCRAQIMKFIADNPGYNLDDKHLEPRLKKLLIFI